MSVNLWSLTVGIISLLVTLLSPLVAVLSIVMYVREKHRRQKQERHFQGFLSGLLVLARGMLGAGNEWRFKVEEKPEGYAMGYANASVNLWKSINERIAEMLNDEVVHSVEVEGSGETPENRPPA